MRKDPLQRNPTPYEMLGLEAGAGDDEIDQAVTSGLGDAAGTETAARDLRDPVERALVDLFLYQDRYLDDIAFDEPIESLSDTAARRRVDERWRAVERRGFPTVAATHSLAVLSYWEARGSGLNGPDLPTPPDQTARLWEAALVRFAALSASEPFWVEWGVVTGNRDLGRAAADALVRRLADELEAMAGLRARNGDVSGEGRIREHLALFRSELEAARALPELRVLSGRGLSPVAIAAGPRLLAEVGLLEKVQAAARERRPDLLPLLTPIAYIGRMVDEREYEGALVALDRLAPEERETAEARGTESRLFLDLGRRDLDTDRVDDALDHFGRAVALSEVRASVANPVSDAVLARAKLLHSREKHDDAIHLLQSAMPLGERGILGVPLAHFLLERADGRIARAEAGGGADLSTEIAAMRGAVADLEEAVTLDPSNIEIRDHRNEAEDLLRALLARRGAEDAAMASAPVAPAPSAEPVPDGSPVLPTRKRSALPSIGIALWVGIGLLALVAYPLFMAGKFGGAGTIVAIVVAVGWIAANALGWVLLR